MITYQEEKIADIWEELVPLLHEHRKEVEDEFITAPLEPDGKQYARMEEHGLFCILTARCNGKLVGYNAFYLYPHSHYPSMKYANNDVLFLLPEYRRSSAGIKLITEAEKMLRKHGVASILMEVRDYRDFSPILKHNGFHKQGTVYMKIIEGD